MSTRIKFATRPIVLLAEQQRDIAAQVLKNVPLGIEVVFREVVKARKPDQNSLMWVGPLADIAEQVWISGRKYAAETWHEYYKAKFMPELDDPDLDELVKKPETYLKWDYTPAGDRVCIASTNGLTVKGFSQYLEQIYADGASNGVRFNERRAA